MLSQQDIQNLKTHAATGGISNTQALTPEQFSQWAKSSSNNIPTGTSKPETSAGISLTPDKSKQFTLGNQVAGGVNKVANFISPIGQDIPVPQGKNSYAQKSFDMVTQQHQELATKLTDAIAKEKSLGKDTTKLETVLTRLNASLPNRKDFNNSGSPEKVIGDAIQTGINAAALLTAIPSGGTSLEGAAALEGGVGALDTALTAAKAGGVYGATQGLGQGLSAEKNAGGVLASTALGGAIGTVGGGIIGGVASKAPDIMSGVDNLVSKGKALTSDIANNVSTDGLGNKIGEALKPNSVGIMNRVARLTPNDASQFEKIAGMSHGQYLADTGNFGTKVQIVEKEATKFVDSMNRVDNALAQLPGKYESPEIKATLDELVAKEQRVSSDGVPSPDLKTVNALKNAYDNGGLDMGQINEAKRLFERNVKLGYSKLINPEAVTKATNLDTALRNWQFAKADELGFSNIRELNKQTQISKFLVNSLGKQITKDAGNNAVGLTDWIMLSHGNPTSLAGLLVKKGFSSEAAQAFVAKLFSGDVKKGFIEPIIGETKFLRLEAPKTNYSGTKVTAPINLPSETATSAEKRIQNSMGISRSIDTRIKKTPLGLPSPSGKSGIIELPGAGTFDKNKYTKSGIIEVIKAKIKNPSDRRRLINVLNTKY